MSHSDVKDQADPSEKEGKAAENGALAPLRIVRAAENNLRDVTVSLPKYKLVVVTGLSGSGKSSLIFDCLVKEAQRQLISTFTSFARQRLPKFDRPKVGAIHNMSTAIVVDQKRIGMSSRATVGTATECFSLLRLIFARLGCCSSIGVDSETGSEANGRARLLLSSASFSFNKPEGMCPGCQGIGQRLQPDITKLVDPALTLATGAVRHPDYRVGGWLWKTLVVTALFDMHLPLSEWSQDDLCVLLFAPKRPVPVDCDRRALLKELTTAARAEMAKSPTARDDLRRVLAPLAQQGGDDEAGPAAGNSTRSSSNSGKSSGAARGGKGARGTRKARKAPSPAGGGDTKPPSRPARAAKRGRAAPKQATAEGPRPRKRAARQAPTRTRSGARSARDASGSSDGSDSSSSSSSGGSSSGRDDGAASNQGDSEGFGSPSESEDSGDEVFAASRFKRGGRTSQGAAAAVAPPPPGSVRMERRPLAEDASMRKRVLAEMGFAVTANFEGVVAGVSRRRLGRGDDASKEKSTEFFTRAACSECRGIRLNARARAVTVNGKTLPELACMEVWELHDWVKTEMADMLTGAGDLDDAAVEEALLEADEEDEEEGEAAAAKAKGSADASGDGLAGEAAARSAEAKDGDEDGGGMRRFAVPAVRNLERRLSSLRDVGVGYLTLAQSVTSLSPGESQRVKLARQLRCGLVGLLYVLDEPTKGCHAHDVGRVVQLARSLVATGNTVVAIDHSTQLLAAADWVVEVGPGAGADGGRVIFEGPFESMLHSDTSVTGQCLRQVLCHDAARRLTRGEAPEGGERVAAAPQPRQRREPQGWMRVRHANVNNLRDLDVALPSQVLCALTGLSGAGKSSLLFIEFLKAHQESCVVIDQSSVGRTSRGCLATYAGAFDHIRKLFAKQSGQPAALYSFNSKGGCPRCKGSGQLDVEMSFLANVRVRCEVCKGRRFNPEALAAKVGGKNVADVLDLTVDEALAFPPLADHRAVSKLLRLLVEVGLGYVTLGQRLNSLSGGEAQRLKLASELSQSGRIYLLDEPSTGLHMKDIARLLRVLARLVENGNSVLLVEHSLQVLSACDYLIDMGPGGGREGGTVVAAGTPEEIVAADTLTGRHLRQVIAQPWGTIEP